MEKASLIFNIHVECCAVNSFINLVTKICGTVTVLTLGESPHHLHNLILSHSTHVPPVQPMQGATLPVPSVVSEVTNRDTIRERGIVDREWPRCCCLLLQDLGRSYSQMVW